LAIPTGVPHLERIVNGIVSYARENAQWIYITNPETHYMTVESLKGWKGDGVIGLLNTKKDLQVAEELACPVVNVSGVFEDTDFPSVRTDYQKVGAMAAEHILKRGFKRFAYYGVKRVWYADEIARGFKKVTDTRSEEFYRFDGVSSFEKKTNWDFGVEMLEAWLLSLPKPIALMTPHDPRGVRLIQVAQQAGIKIPEEIAVISANNGETTCEFCKPSLTSVDRNDGEVGFEAAHLLHQLIKDKKKTGDEKIVIQPKEVVIRHSTDIFNVEDERLKEVVKFIQDNNDQNFNVADICQHIGKSRRWLEQCFAENLNQSPNQYLSEQRVEKAKVLLLDKKKYKLAAVATLCGFGGSTQLNRVFKKHVGQSPKEFRSISQT
jgi:LacI family transcriptional regulator